MPVMSGWELLEALREQPSLSRIPTVVVSAARDLERLPPSTRVLRKPFDLSELVAFLEKA
jgi:CheY-like chemotaxis protein